MEGRVDSVGTCLAGERMLLSCAPGTPGVVTADAAGTNAWTLFFLVLVLAFLLCVPVPCLSHRLMPAPSLLQGTIDRSALQPPLRCSLHHSHATKSVCGQLGTAGASEGHGHLPPRTKLSRARDKQGAVLGVPAYRVSPDPRCLSAGPALKFTCFDGNEGSPG